MIIIRKKSFSFAKTSINYNNMKNSFKAGNYDQAIKSGVSSASRGTLGVAKVAIPVIGAATVGKQVLDKVTGEDINNSNY